MCENKSSLKSQIATSSLESECKINGIKKVIGLVLFVGMAFIIIKQQREIRDLSNAVDACRLSLLQTEIKQVDKQVISEKGYEVPDDEYKLFYGEWEIVEFMGISRYCPGEKQEDIIGHRIYYDEEKMKVDGETVIEKPIYMCGIIPCEYSHFYTKVKPANTESTALVWGDKEDFFVHVRIKPLVDMEGKFIQFSQNNSFVRSV